jgi:hypothetical protein
MDLLRPIGYSQTLLRQEGKMAATIWEVRGLWYDTVSSKQYSDREKAYVAFDTMVRSDPAWLELFEIEVGEEPRRLRRYELPRMVKKGRR